MSDLRADLASLADEWQAVHDRWIGVGDGPRVAIFDVHARKIRSLLTAHAPADPAAVAEADGWDLVDAERLMQWAQQFGVGWVAWSTAGNDAANAWLDLMPDWSGTTGWGNRVWYGQYGIANTARPASIF